jgi:hypothetical protein
MIYQYEHNDKDNEVAASYPLTKMFAKINAIKNTNTNTNLHQYTHLGLPVGLVFCRSQPEKIDFDETTHSVIPNELFERLFQEVTIIPKKRNTLKKMRNGVNTRKIKIKNENKNENEK